jgi:hypothetical protein
MMAETTFNKKFLRGPGAVFIKKGKKGARRNLYPRGFAISFYLWYIKIIKKRCRAAFI